MTLYDSEMDRGWLYLLHGKEDKRSDFHGLFVVCCSEITHI